MCACPADRNPCYWYWITTPVWACDTSFPRETRPWNDECHVTLEGETWQRRKKDWSLWPLVMTDQSSPTFNEVLRIKLQHVNEPNRATTPYVENTNGKEILSDGYSHLTWCVYETIEVVLSEEVDQNEWSSAKETKEIFEKWVSKFQKKKPTVSTSRRKTCNKKIRIVKRWLPIVGSQVGGSKELKKKHTGRETRTQYTAMRKTLWAHQVVVGKTTEHKWKKTSKTRARGSKADLADKQESR